MPEKPIEWTEEMGEVSGFGDSYERACRDMILAGVRWLHRNPDADLRFGEYEGVMGLIESDTPDSDDLHEAMLDSVEGSPTGAMMQWCTKHVMYVKENGWDEYVEFMERRDDA